VGAKCLQVPGTRAYGRGGGNTVEVELVDGIWTEAAVV
jgi:hypothetical protein